VFGLVDKGPQQIGVPADGQAFEYGTVCLDAVNYQVGSSWTIPIPDGQNRTPASVLGGNTVIVHQLQHEVGSTSFDVPWDIHGALFLEHGGCSEVFKRTTQYTNSPTLRINGHDLQASQLDGMFGGDAGDGHAGYDLKSSRAELSGSIDRGFAVWLRFADSFDLPRATRAGAVGDWYVPQRVNDHDWIVWFRDPLIDGQTIVLEPP
jgi:hypothetical protein